MCCIQIHCQGKHPPGISFKGGGTIALSLMFKARMVREKGISTDYEVGSLEEVLVVVQFVGGTSTKYTSKKPCLAHTKKVFLYLSQPTSFSSTQPL